jgi:uncharacterized protein YjbI with pentapeptide repeats
MGGRQTVTTEFRNCRDRLSAEDSDLSESRFADTRLEKSSFLDVNLRRASFSDVNLSNASLVNVNLADVSIENAKLDGMKIDGILVSVLMEAYRRDRPKPGVVLFVANLAKVTKFYETIGSLSLVHADRDHAVLECAHFELAIHAIPESIAAGIEIANPPEVRESTPFKLCLPVSSIDDARVSAAALGGMLKTSAEEWVDRGFRVCDGYDPEGNVIQVRSRL